MSIKVCYWDEVDGVQKERDATPEEVAEIEALRQNADAQDLRRREDEARQERNRLLAATDWTQAKDIPDAVSNKYTAYRQALRDVPQQTGFPDAVVWPVKPE